MSIDTDKPTPKDGFFKYVFSFNEENTGEIQNIIQYSLLSILPIVGLNKLIQRFIPEATDEKGSIEIVFEIILQILVIFVGMYFINKIILYIPTFSKQDYPEFSLVSITLITIMFLFSFQTKLGEKMNILIERLEMLWNGGNDGNKKRKNKKNTQNYNGGDGGMRVSQPITSMGMMSSPTQPVMVSTTGTNQMNAMNTSLIDSLPTSQQIPQQPQPDYNAMFQNTPTPLVGASSPSEGFASSQEIMPANSILGNNFGSNF